MTTQTRPATIPLQRPTFGPEEERAAVEVIRSGWVSQGPRVAEFERQFAQYIGCKEAVAVSNCTVALHVTLVAMGIKAGDEVIVPSHTFIATPNAVSYIGAVPVFVDIEPVYYMINPDKIEKAITAKTRAIMPVDLCMPAELDLIYEIADRHGISVIEDAAPAIGTSYRGHKVGNSRGPVCFSFHPRKVITTGEGGMIATNSSELADKLRLLRQHAMSTTDLARHNSQKVIFEEYGEIGFNYRMTDIQAAIGIEQLKKVDAIVTERRRLAHRYIEHLAELSWIVPPSETSDRSQNYQSFIARLTPNAPVDRDEFMRQLWQRGIQTRRGIMNCHLERPYLDRTRSMDLPESEKALRETVILPLYPDMTDDEQDFVIDTIRELPLD